MIHWWIGNTIQRLNYCMHRIDRICDSPNNDRFGEASGTGWPELKALFLRYFCGRNLLLPNSLFSSFLFSFPTQGKARLYVRARLWDICGYRFSPPPTGAVDVTPGYHSTRTPLFWANNSDFKARRRSPWRSIKSHVLTLRSLLHPSSLSRSKQSTAKRKRVESGEKHGRKREKERHAIYSYPTACYPLNTLDRPE